MLQRVAVCSFEKVHRLYGNVVLRLVAICVLLCVAASYSELQRVAACCSVLQHVAASCSILQ